MQDHDGRSYAARLPRQRRAAKPEPTPDMMYRRAIDVSVRALGALRAASAACPEGTERGFKCAMLSGVLGRYLATVMQEEEARKLTDERPAGADAASFVSAGGRA